MCILNEKTSLAERAEGLLPEDLLDEPESFRDLVMKAAKADWASTRVKAGDKGGRTTTGARAFQRSSTMPNDSRTSTRTFNRSVSFGVVQVREYERTVGDHPDAKNGPPLGLGWAFLQQDDQPIAADDKPKKTKAQLNLDGNDRRFILRNVFRISPLEMLEAELQAEKTREQRRESAKEAWVLFI